MQPRRAVVCRWAILLCATAVLPACQSIDVASARIDAPGVPVALDTIEGAPDALKPSISAEVASQASARKIELVQAGSQPRYRLKGYVTAYPSDAGDTTLAVVWDVFDSSKNRAQRVTTTTVAKGQASDPWDTIGQSQIAKATSQSMNQVAAFLSGSAPAPESEPEGGASAQALGFSATP